MFTGRADRGGDLSHVVVMPDKWFEMLHKIIKTGIYIALGLVLGILSERKRQPENPYIPVLQENIQKRADEIMERMERVQK